MNADVEELEVIIKRIRYKNIVWIPDPNSQHNVKKNYFSKWLHDKKPGDVFTLESFYKKYPKHRTDMGCKRRVEKTISALIKEGKINMWIKKDEFKVMK